MRGRARKLPCHRDVSAPLGDRVLDAPHPNFSEDELDALVRSTHS